jgi:hypothetical protein
MNNLRPYYIIILFSKDNIKKKISQRIKLTKGKISCICFANTLYFLFYTLIISLNDQAEIKELFAEIQQFQK